MGHSETAYERSQIHPAATGRRAGGLAGMSGAATTCPHRRYGFLRRTSALNTSARDAGKFPRSASRRSLPRRRKTRWKSPTASLAKRMRAWFSTGSAPCPRGSVCILLCDPWFEEKGGREGFERHDGWGISFYPGHPGRHRGSHRPVPLAAPRAARPRVSRFRFCDVAGDD